MKSFSQLAIPAPEQQFRGDRVEIYNVFNVEIVVSGYRIVPSKFLDKGLTERLDMQIEIDGKEHLLWTSSVQLIKQITSAKKDDFPFKTTIKKINKGYVFT